MRWQRELRAAFIIFIKDLKQYYGKAPTLSWGLLFPFTLVVLLGIFAGAFEPWRMVPGLLSIALLFSATTMPQVALGFDKMSGGISRLIYAPLSSSAVVFGKALGGVFFGMVGAGIAVGVLAWLSGPVPVINPAFLAAGLVIGALTFSFLGVLFAAALEPTQAVAALNFARFAMIFLGGAVIPRTVMPAFLTPLVYSTPLVHTTELIRYGAYNLYDYTDPYTALIAGLIYMTALALISFRLVLRLLTP